jgi:hypothetical protein
MRNPYGCGFIRVCRTVPGEGRDDLRVRDFERPGDVEPLIMAAEREVGVASVRYLIEQLVAQSSWSAQQSAVRSCPTSFWPCRRCTVLMT